MSSNLESCPICKLNLVESTNTANVIHCIESDINHYYVKQFSIVDNSILEIEAIVSPKMSIYHYPLQNKFYCKINSTNYEFSDKDRSVMDIYNQMISLIIFT